MGWVRLSDDFYDHPKFAGAGPLAVALWAAGLAWCNRNLTDGYIPASRARLLLDFDGLAWVSGMRGEDVQACHVIEILVAANLWDEVDGGYRFHDFHDYQPTAQQVQQRRVEHHEAKVSAGKARAAGASRDQQGRLTKGQVRASIPSSASTNGTTSVPAAPPPAHQPQPQTQVLLSSSLETHEDFHSPVDDDDPDIVVDAITMLALGDLERRITEKGPVGDREAWLATGTYNRRLHHADQLAALDLSTYTSAEALARHLEPPPKPVLSLVTRDMRPECVDCSSSGMVLNDSGEAVRCPACNAREPAS